MTCAEETLKAAAEIEISRCRPGDWRHACRVAAWVRKLGAGQQNLPLLLAAAYIHDIGWRGMVPQHPLTFDELLRLEPQANSNSAPYAALFLSRLNYNASNIARIQRLIAAADAHSAKDSDEGILVDADSLSKLCIEHLVEKFPPSEWLALFRHWSETFGKRMTTAQARAMLPDLLNDLHTAISARLRSENQFVYKITAGRAFSIGSIKGRAVTSSSGRSSGDVAIMIVRGRHGGVMDRVSDRFYVVTEGSGSFTIADSEYSVGVDDVVVIPPNTAYDFTGEMKLVMFCSPPFDSKNDVAIPEQAA